jgi:hypothetical protein
MLPATLREAELRWGSTFKLDPGFEKTPESARAVKEELDRLKGNRGSLAADDVLDAARDPSSPMHGAFTWDDSEAAELWRREQARELIRAVRVVTILKGPSGKESTAAAVPVYASYRPAGEGRAYREVYAALGDPDHARALLKEAIDDLAKFRRRYAALRELAGVFREVDDLLARSAEG